jgi:LacI family transcriptional regulator
MNIYDIAEEAGVSISTVSRVLNNKSNVKPATREKVEQVLQKHNYSPSAIARGLVSKSLNTVGILTIDVRVPHDASTAYLLEHELDTIGYNASLCNTSGKAENGVDYIRMLLKKGVSGIVLIGSVFQDRAIESTLAKHSPTVPFIVMNSTLEADNTYSVMINHESGMKLALDHLRERGHSDIVYVSDADSYSGRRKVNAFTKLVQKSAGGTGSEGRVFRTERGVAGGRDAVDRILASKIPFSAIVFGDDTTAIGGIQRLQRLGHKIPEDVAVMGWNNTEGDFSDPTLTSIDNQHEMMGIICIKMMENLLSGIEISPSVSIDSNLVIREST